MDSRALQALQTENHALRQQLQSLLHEARLNEDKMRRFDQLEHQLIGADGLLDLVTLLLTGYKQAFAIDQVALTLVDPEQELSRILSFDSGAAHALAGLHLPESPEALERAYTSVSQPQLGRFDPLRHGALFAPDSSERIASVALLPLNRHGQLIGGLHFGSHDASRYEAGTGTQLLERLGHVVAVCLESAINQERLKLSGLTDGLTGVYNRRFFEHRCLIEIAQARRYRHPLACLFLDVDRFKSINDLHGHPMGDEVLRCIGQLIQGQLRAGDTVARYGGEEFVVLLPQTSAEFAGEIAERIRSSVAEQRFISAHPGTGNRQEIAVSSSIGLAMLTEGASAHDANGLAALMVAAADQALYQAKQGGRNRVVFARA
ncbi:GGDEF domain-containing protein [Roseateles koreensis]|uniref:diguanylate cyclase n=1 Tax=Roseateles koreensis TaxID=2987526 RepID=A0ABT5KXV2_9BURK|nr:DUF484 family protein [Roseateles koreensis]MDC8786577.1 DUF484 family protein [Roseateles koreensis]